jgi:hypothetical protein
MTPPEYASDRFRDERCARCGDVIGFAFFDAREYVMADGSVVVNFTHRNRDYTFPSWCERIV